MKIASLVLLLLFIGFPAASQEQLTRIITGKDFRVKPSASELVPALASSGSSKISTSVTIVFDQRGNVTNLKLDKPTGSATLDSAILAWAAKVKINTEQEGMGTIPMTFQLN